MVSTKIHCMYLSICGKYQPVFLSAQTLHISDVSHMNQLIAFIIIKYCDYFMHHINFLYVLYYVEMTYQMFGLVGLHILKPPFLYVLGGEIVNLAICG